jgi:hypothetical protein
MEPDETVIVRSGIDATIMYTLAGPVAEECFAGDRQLPNESIKAAANDRKQALRLARRRDEFVMDCRETDPRYGLPPEELVETLRALSRRLLRHAPLWSGIEEIAEKLLKRDRMEYDEVSRVLESTGVTIGVPRDLGPWFPRKG